MGKWTIVIGRFRAVQHGWDNSDREWSKRRRESEIIVILNSSFPNTWVGMI
jgi:hypothetical protein